VADKDSGDGTLETTGTQDIASGGAQSESALPESEPALPEPPLLAISAACDASTLSDASLSQDPLAPSDAPAISEAPGSSEEPAASDQITTALAANEQAAAVPVNETTANETAAPTRPTVTLLPDPVPPAFTFVFFDRDTTEIYSAESPAAEHQAIENKIHFTADLPNPAPPEPQSDPWPATRAPLPVEPELRIPPRDAEPAQRAPTQPESRLVRVKSLLWKAARYAAYGAAGYLALVLALIPVFRFIDPPGSTLMLGQILTGTSIERTWVPLDDISPNLIRAVVVSEDGRFCDHWGIDIEAMQEAIAQSGGRGASTISMQVTKNLFLWSSRSYIRKLIELPLTVVSELVWPKWRILEIYLNVAEWGPGIFGAEAAARHHFDKSAARLSPSEAALLAASLPNPVARDAGDPGPRTASKARVIQARVRAYGNVASCVTSRFPAQEQQPEPTFKPLRKAQPTRRRQKQPDEIPFFIAP